MAYFYGLGSIVSRLQSYLEKTVYFSTTKYPRVPGTHLIDLGKVKRWIDLEATQWLLN